MATTTVFSKRIYKDKLESSVVNHIQTMLKVVNDAKIKAYADQMYHKRKESDESIHLFIKRTFNLNTYFTNFAVTESKWVVRSNKELQTLYIEELTENIKSREKHIKTLTKKLEFWTKIKKYLIELSKDKKNGKTLKLKKFKCYEFYQDEDEVKVKCNYSKEIQIWNVYLFEIKVVNSKLKSLKNQIQLKTHGLENQKHKLEKLKSKPYRTCFGTKKLFKSQFTTHNENHQAWKEEFDYQRHKSIQLQGVRTAEQGNFCVRYNRETNQLKLALPFQNEVPKGKSKASLSWIEIPNVEFTYQKEKYFEALNTPKNPIAYRIEDHKEYYLIKATFEWFVDEEHVQFSKELGVIGYDLNVDHIAYAETDGTGNLIDRGVISFNLEGKTSGQTTKILEQVAIDLVTIAKAKGKPLVGEDIKRLKKTDMTYRNKKQNRKVSLFAYQQLIQMIKRRAFEELLDVTYVDPAYTSQIGKIKYMKLKGLSIHEAAAYVIARRGQGFNEKQKQYKKYNLKWNSICSHFKKVRKHYLYQVPKCDETYYPDLKFYTKAIETLNEVKLNKKSKEKAIRQMA